MVILWNWEILLRLIFLAKIIYEDKAYLVGLILTIKIIYSLFLDYNFSALLSLIFKL